MPRSARQEAGQYSVPTRSVMYSAQYAAIHGMALLRIKLKHHFVALHKGCLSEAHDTPTSGCSNLHAIQWCLHGYH